jgi:hypothetical protein
MELYNKEEKISHRYEKVGSSNRLKVSMLRRLSCTMSYDQVELEASKPYSQLIQSSIHDHSLSQPFFSSSTTLLDYHSQMHSYHRTLIQALMLSQLAQSEHNLLSSNIKEINLDINSNRKSIRSKLVSLRSNILKPLKSF